MRLFVTYRIAFIRAEISLLRPTMEKGENYDQQMVVNSSKFLGSFFFLAFAERIRIFHFNDSTLRNKHKMLVVLNRTLGSCLGGSWHAWSENTMGSRTSSFMKSERRRRWLWAKYACYAKEQKLAAHINALDRQARSSEQSFTLCVLNRWSWVCISELRTFFAATALLKRYCYIP